MLSVSRVEPEQIPGVFLEVEPMIERALSHGQGDTTNKAELVNGLLSGDLVMWAVHEGDDITAALILSVREYPNKTTLYVELVAGRSLDEWIDDIEGLLRDFAYMRGIDTIEASCRKGLARRLKRRGWNTKAVIMELI